MSSVDLGFTFLELPTVDSTNNYAMGMVHAGMAQHGMAVFAGEQTRGRGQRSKVWFSQAGQSISLSIIIRPDALSSSRLFLLSQMAAVAAHRFFLNYSLSDTFIKWPNDIFWRDRKAGGILIENSFKGPKWMYAVIGIGLNINQADFPDLDRKAVSLRQITGQNYEPAQLARSLCTYMDAAWKELLIDPASIDQAYQQALFRRGARVKFKQDSRIFEALVKGVNENGQLVVQHELEESFDVGTLEWLL
ncbi:MAG TPA: biotin--[acetyl-CoA-carboxylase] ligase [Flavisolibacter sp.]|nr:biotin--[acetyl-CoA-carboxylase] ligase [Flavisolibacter sp.]